jgi:hypothetical protein
MSGYPDDAIAMPRSGEPISCDHAQRLIFTNRPFARSIIDAFA